MEPYCFGVTITATFGENVILDDSFDQDDLGAITYGSELRQSKVQAYYAGMPLKVEVLCSDAVGAPIGSATYEGKLVTPNESSYFTLWNYAEPAVKPTDCVTPTAASGTQMCGVASGFDFQ